MTQDIARRTTGISLSFAVLVVALGCDARSPFAPIPPPTPATKYNLSGIVTDDNGSPVANAELTLSYDTSKSAETSTDASGRYSIAFAARSSVYDGNAGVVGLIFYTGGGQYENWHVQAVPWGTPDIVKDLRLRRVRTVNAGESIVISIDPDSSLVYDSEDWPSLKMDWVCEKFHVRVADAGTLTVAARWSGDIAPQIAVYCLNVADNCDNVFVNAPPGTAVRQVNANSLFEIKVAIPSYMTPQRYEVATSRQ